MPLRSIILLVAIVELIAALILYRAGQEFVSLLIGAAITFMIAEMLSNNRA